MATKLGLYNAALREIGNTRLATITDDIEGRYVLDDVYDSVLEYCLEQGSWNFALRDASLASAGAATNGYVYYFTKPTDWVRTASISSSDTYIPPLENYHDQVGRLYADVTPLYLKYVSNDATYGLLLTGWPESFTRYVELELAWRIAKRINQSGADKEQLKEDRKIAKGDARTKDAINEATPKQIQPGRLVRSRFGGAPSRDRVGSSLIG